VAAGEFERPRDSSVAESSMALRSAGHDRAKRRPVAWVDVSAPASTVRMGDSAAGKLPG
jgi:hypothetical protein